MRRLINILILLIVSLCMHSQSLKVKSFEYVQNDLSARTNQRKDINNNICALLKVRLTLPSAKFKGDIVGIVDYKDSEYWVYISPGSRMISVVMDGFLPLDIEFSSYDIKSIESQCTYVLTIELPFIENKANIMKLVTISVIPNIAELKIDNLKFSTNNGIISVPLSIGTHSYTLTASNYEHLNGFLYISESMPEDTISLIMKKEDCTLSISSTPIDAEVIVDNLKIGKTPLNHKIVMGKHDIAIRKEGYSEERFSLELNDTSYNIHKELFQKNRIYIDTNPRNVKVIIDGQKADSLTPLSMDLKNGKHEICLSKSGFVTKTDHFYVNAESSMLSFDLKKEYLKHTNVYCCFGSDVRNLSSLDFGIGCYLSNISINVTLRQGLHNSEEIFWNNDINYPSSFVYTPTEIELKTGYGLLINRRIRITPEIGFGMSYLKGTTKNDGETNGANKSFCSKVIIASRIEIATTHNFGFFIKPVFSKPIKESRTYDALCSISPFLNNWAKQINIRIGIYRSL